MKYKSLFFSLIAATMTMSGCNAQTAFISVDADEFEKLIADDNIVCLDVRTNEEYVEGHIAAQALNIDVKQDEFEQRALAALPKNCTIAVYCRSGNRSKKACDILARNGFTVVELATGISGWQSNGKPVTREETDVFQTKASERLVKIHRIKHGSLSIQVDDKWIYVDPVTSAVQPVTDYTTVPKADYILVTHEHHDHLDAKAIEQLTKEGTTLVLNPRSREILDSSLASYKGTVEVMKNGDQMKGKWQIDAVPAYNSSAERQQFHPKGRDNGYVITIEGLRIYIAGDTEDIPEMENVKDIDVAFLPCNLPFTMTPEQVAHAASIIKPRVLIPYHYGKTEIQQVQRLLDGSGIDVRIRQYQ